MGYIKLFRTIREWDWYGDPNTTALWVHILVGANSKDSVMRGEIIRRGTLLTSISRLASESGMSERQIRTGLLRLENAGEITKDVTNKWTKITVCKYDDYLPDSEIGFKSDDTQPTKGCQPPADGQNADKDKKDIPAGKDGLKKTVRRTQQTEDAVGRIYSLYPSSTKRPEGNKVALKSAKKNKAHIARMLGSGEYTEASLTYSIKQYLSETSPEYIKMFETFLNQVPDYSSQSQQQTADNDTLPSYDDALEAAKNPTKDEIKEWWEKRIAPFYPKGPSESAEQYRARVKPSYERELKSWIENRIERVNQRYL